MTHAEVEVKTRPAPPRRFSKAIIREGYSGAERRKKILRYFCLREARGGAGRVFSPRGGAGDSLLVIFDADKNKVISQKQNFPKLASVSKSVFVIPATSAQVCILATGF